MGFGSGWVLAADGFWQRMVLAAGGFGSGWFWILDFE
jgi:hypothetical protein